MKSKFIVNQYFSTKTFFRIRLMIFLTSIIGILCFMLYEIYYEEIRKHTEASSFSKLVNIALLIVNIVGVWINCHKSDDE